MTAREAAKAKKPKDAEEADAFADVEDDEDWDEDFETVEASQDVELPDNDPQAVVDAEADAVEQIIEGSTAATDESTSTIDEEEKDEEIPEGEVAAEVVESVDDSAPAANDTQKTEE